MRQNGLAFSRARDNMSHTVRHMVDACVEASTYEPSVWSRHCSVHKGGLHHEIESNVRSGPYSFSSLG
jgi:hypothetical protein